MKILLTSFVFLFTVFTAVGQSSSGELSSALVNKLQSTPVASITGSTIVLNTKQLNTKMPNGAKITSTTIDHHEKSNTYRLVRTFEFKGKSYKHYLKVYKKGNNLLALSDDDGGANSGDEEVGEVINCETQGECTTCEATISGSGTQSCDCAGNPGKGCVKSDICDNLMQVREFLFN